MALHQIFPNWQNNKQLFNGQNKSWILNGRWPKSNHCAMLAIGSLPFEHTHTFRLFYDHLSQPAACWKSRSTTLTSEVENRPIFTLLYTFIYTGVRKQDHFSWNPNRYTLRVTGDLSDSTYLNIIQTWPVICTFRINALWPRGFADAVLGTAYELAI